MSLICLIIAGLFEVFWSTMMKLSQGFSNLFYSFLTIVGMILSFAGLIFATKHLPISIAYLVWTGIGAVGSVLVGIFLFHKNLNGTIVKGPRVNIYDINEFSPSKRHFSYMKCYSLPYLIFDNSIDCVESLIKTLEFTNTKYGSDLQLRLKEM